MLDPDPLDSRFAAFRRTSIATTQRPGVAAVRRTVARRRAIRTLTAGALTALVAGTAIWFTRIGTVPHPSSSASASPTTAVTASPTSATPSPASTPPTLPSSGAPVGAGQAQPTCPTRKPNFPQVLSGDPVTVSPSDYFAQCPTARLRIIGGTYEWDVSRQQYRLVNVQTSYLNAATPTLAMPRWKPDALGNACGYAFITAWSDLDPPTVLPASMSAAQNYYANPSGFGYSLDILWNTRTPADLASVPACQPPVASGPTP